MYMEEKGLRHFWRWEGLASTDSKNFHKIMVMKTVVWEQGQTNCSKEQNKEPRIDLHIMETYFMTGWKSQM